MEWARQGESYFGSICCKVMAEWLYRPKSSLCARVLLPHVEDIDQEQEVVIQDTPFSCKWSLAPYMVRFLSELHALEKGHKMRHILAIVTPKHSDLSQCQQQLDVTHPLIVVITYDKYGKNPSIHVAVANTKRTQGTVLHIAYKTQTLSMRDGNIAGLHKNKHTQMI